jgi:hypothetical protein
MAQFGLGVSVYLLQLCIIAVISFLAGVIMIPALLKYSSNNEGNVADYRLAGSATCEVPIPVNVTCANHEICLGDHRESCPLYETTILCDVVMSLLLLIIFYLNMFIEEVEDRMDEVIQTAQDYSVVVRDPPPDATNPDEYQQFFQRFGRVKNITVTKKNKFLHQLLLQKQLILRHIRLHERVRELTVYSNKSQHNWCVLLAQVALVSLCLSLCLSLSLSLSLSLIAYTHLSIYLQSVGLFLEEDYWMNRLVAVNKKLQEEYKKVCYEACR